MLRKIVKRDGGFKPNLKPNDYFQAPFPRVPKKLPVGICFKIKQEYMYTYKYK